MLKGARSSRICDGINISIRSLQRWRKNLADRRKGPKRHYKVFSAKERIEILSLLLSEEYCDYPPHQIVAKLADQGVYKGSASSMYKILREENLLAHRGRSKKPTHTPKLETKATGPNQVWCWDITYIPSKLRGHWYFLYVFEDIYSRKIVGYKLEKEESDVASESLFTHCLKAEGITGERLRLHNDNGNVMKGYFFTEKLKSLGVIQSFSRPSVSNDNPYIESLFKTMKYRPHYPYRPFRSMQEAETWIGGFVKWYNNHHLHSGIQYVTPVSRHIGEDETILSQRRKIFQKAQAKKPWRWSKAPKNWQPETTVELSASGCRIK